MITVEGKAVAFVLSVLSLLLFSMSQDFSSYFVRCSASLGAVHCSTSMKSVFSSFCCGMCVLLACVGSAV